jgi:hypothetical protein
MNKHTLLVFNIDRSVQRNLIQAHDLIYLPIWKSKKTNWQQLECFVHENVPSGTFIANFSLNSHIDTVQTLAQIQMLTIFSARPPRIVYSFLVDSNDSKMFDIESHSGHIRLKFEPDYEQRRHYDVRVRACLTQVKLLFDINSNGDDDTLCFEQIKSIRINIINKNDNEPRLRVKGGDYKELNTRDLMRAMTLFTFSVEDLDGKELNEFKHRTFNDSFEVFKMWTDENENDDDAAESSFYGVKLSDLGYAYMVNLVQTNSFFEIVCEVSDGLFTNRITFNLSIKFNQNWSHHPKQPLVAPIVHTIELYENTRGYSRLLNISHIFKKKRDMGTTKYTLKNYQDIFYVSSSNGEYLSVRDNYEQFDREKCEAYELFVNDFRILVKILDVNDNAPRFHHENDVANLDVNGKKEKIQFKNPFKKFKNP